MFELGHVRHSERREVDFLCEVVAGEWNAPFQHRATDLSPTGVWLQTSFPLAVDDVVVLNLRPPGWRQERDLTVFARVARSVRVRERNGQRENGMGVRFLDITDDERREWISTLDGVSMISDGFIPFRDNIDHAQRHGVRFIAQPGGSSRDEEVNQACREYGIAMAHTGVRLFHH